MLVREIFPRMRLEGSSTCASSFTAGLSEPLRISLDEGTGDDTRISSKMSKSKPASGILIHDDERVIRDKIGKAFCL